MNVDSTKTYSSRVTYYHFCMLQMELTLTRTSRNLKQFKTVHYLDSLRYWALPKYGFYSRGIEGIRPLEWKQKTTTTKKLTLSKTSILPTEAVNRWWKWISEECLYLATRTLHHACRRTGNVGALEETSDATSTFLCAVFIVNNIATVVGYSVLYTSRYMKVNLVVS